MNYADAPGKFDERVALPASSGKDGEEGAFEVYVEPGALMHIIGTRMHWKDTDLVSEFVFENPNATGHCGCGESFSVG